MTRKRSAVTQETTKLSGLHENANVSYTLLVKLANATLVTRSFSLANNEQWENSVAFAPTHSGAGQKLAFSLYKRAARTWPRCISTWP